MTIHAWTFPKCDERRAIHRELQEALRPHIRGSRRFVCAVFGDDVLDGDLVDVVVVGHDGGSRLEFSSFAGVLKLQVKISVRWLNPAAQTAAKGAAR